MSFQAITGLMVVASLAFVGFFIYFVFKQLQFVIQAINLYKKMVTRQDTMIMLLKDIRKGGNPGKQPTVTVCKNCGKRYDEDLRGQFCEECGTKLS